MAYNTKYILSYCNAKRIPLRIELQVKDYVGEALILVDDDVFLQDDEGRLVAVNIDGVYDPERDKNKVEGSDNPFTLTYQNDISEKGGTIRATVATMSFYEDLLFNIDDLATSDETEMRAVFYYDNKIEWIGFVIPDFFNVPIELNPVINLTASDRIGILKDISYVVPDLNTDDRVTYMDIIVKCLKETGLELNINTVCDLTSDLFNSGATPINPFTHTYVSELRFVKDEETGETENYYDVLKSICDQFNCLFTQYNGEWWIFNKEQLEEGAGEILSYNHNGAFLASTNLDQTEINFSLINTGGERTLIPAGGKNTYLLNQGEEIVYPLNKSLKRSVNSNLVVPNWTVISPFIAAYLEPPDQYFPNGSIEIYDSRLTNGLEVYKHFITQVSNDTTNITPVPALLPLAQAVPVIESDLFKVVTFDSRRTSFKLSVNAVGKPQTAVMIGLYLKFNDDPANPRYAILTTTVSENGRDFTGEYVFVFVDQQTVSLPMVPVMFDNKYKNANLASEANFEITVSAANGQNQNYDLSKAEMFIRVYPNVAYKKNTINPNLTEITNYIKKISVEFLNDNQTPRGVVFQSILQANYTKPTEQRNVFFGDYQTTGQNGFFYKGREDSLSIQYNALGERLKDWYTGVDSERNPLLIHSLRQLTRSYGRSHDELSIGFDLDRINPFAKYAIKCFSDRYILDQDNEYITSSDGTYITASIGKYLNNKKFVFVEGKIDYLRGQFEGKLAQTRTEEVENTEYIYSYFEQKNIS